MYNLSHSVGRLQIHGLIKKTHCLDFLLWQQKLSKISKSFPKGHSQAGTSQVQHNPNLRWTSCQIPLICQRSGLFLERLELAAWDQNTINLVHGGCREAAWARLAGGEAWLLLSRWWGSCKTFTLSVAHLWVKDFVIFSHFPNIWYAFSVLLFLLHKKGDFSSLGKCCRALDLPSSHFFSSCHLFQLIP